ncbi:MAG: leucine/isoleucine/valine transporter permease subunit [Chloroflexota bacterium]
MNPEKKFTLRDAINQGLIAGIITALISMVGMVELFSKRQLIANVMTTAQVFILIAPTLISYQSAKKAAKNNALASGAVTGFFASIPVIVLVLLASAFDLRQFLINVSPNLITTLTFGQGAVMGSLILAVISTSVGLGAAGLYLSDEKYRKPILTGLLWTLLVGMFSEILQERLRAFFGIPFTNLIIRSKALQPVVAVILLVGITAIAYYWGQRGASFSERIANQSATQRRNMTIAQRVAFFVLLLAMPLLLGSYLSEVVNNVGIYVLMGLGLNIVVGFAGLLDLGYVAFFAIGAYVMAIMTSEGFLGVTQTSFWVALPVSVITAVAAGVFLGTPVLRMRGDYLAIVTLGFGEIIRIMANSDLLKPYIGGAQGVLQIPKPSFFGTSLIQPGQLYYVVLAGVLLAWFVSTRLSNSRLGRQWMAMREDEDVAEAMGINLVNTKLLAFAIGAGFSGLSGAIYASKLTSIFPHSFNLLISINVLSLIIVGGMGSLPGVVVGSLILVGLPELLREFAEFRLWMYGALLVVMMLAKPEGFWPSAITKRELHAYDENIPIEEPVAAD